MDKVSDIIDFFDIIEMPVFIAGGFIFLWIIGKIQKALRKQKRKQWKRKKINW